MTTIEGQPKRRIGVMTSGGDAPGMNGAVRAVVRMSIAKGCEAYGIYEGYEGLVQGGDLIKKMSWDDVRGWLSEGGTLIGTARCPAFRERDGRRTAAKNMIMNGIDALIICGGDGSLTGADTFRSEWPDLLNELVQRGELKQEQVAPHKLLNIVGMVGSIDNDMSLTDATIGCYSSLGRICEMVDYIDATASSHQRAFVIEVMGRHCGWLALMSGVSTGADFVFLPERPPSADWKKEMCSVVSKVRPAFLHLVPSSKVCSTAIWVNERQLSLLPKVPTIDSYNRSKPPKSRTFLQTSSNWILESQHSAMSSEVVMLVPTIECFLRYRALKL